MTYSSSIELRNLHKTLSSARSFFFALTFGHVMENNLIRAKTFYSLQSHVQKFNTR